MMESIASSIATVRYVLAEIATSLPSKLKLTAFFRFADCRRASYLSLDLPMPSWTACELKGLPERRWEKADSAFTYRAASAPTATSAFLPAAAERRPRSPPATLAPILRAASLVSHPLT
jgi:hypothetical protein